MRWGSLIRDARAARGWNQQELADRVGASITTVSNWERDYTRPGVDDVDKITRALDISPEVLLRAMGVTLTPPIEARLPRSLVVDLLQLKQADLFAVQRVVRGLLLDRDRQPGTTP